MANVTTRQLAELLIGIARTQQAIVEAIESQKAGFRSNHLAPALDNAARVRVTTRALTLQEFPARVLLQCLGRAGPNLEQITRDLQALLDSKPATPASASASAAPAAEAPSLDMT